MKVMLTEESEFHVLVSALGGESELRWTQQRLAEKEDFSSTLKERKM